MLQLAVVSRGHVLQLRESFASKRQYREQHELEMRQREEQQRMFTRIDQSRQATLEGTLKRSVTTTATAATLEGTLKRPATTTTPAERITTTGTSNSSSTCMYMYVLAVPVHTLKTHRAFSMAQGLNGY